MLAHIIDDTSVSVVIDGKFRTVERATKRGQALVNALRTNPQDVTKIKQLADVSSFIAKKSLGRVVVDSENRLRLDGELIDYGLTEILLETLSDNGNVEHFVRFIENVHENPDKSVAEQVYGFISKGRMPLTPDGHFLAFKRVDSDYRSFRSGRELVTVTTADRIWATHVGRIPNPLGAIVAMDRALCDPNRQKTCSVGLHACSHNYLGEWYKRKGIVLIVKINPRDVTAVPLDYNQAKLRTCRYEVISAVPDEEALNDLFVKHRSVGWEDDVLEDYDDDVEEDDDSNCEMKAEDLGFEDGKSNALKDLVFKCDPQNGANCELISEAYYQCYAERYEESYAEHFTLAVDFSGGMFELGERDGENAAIRDGSRYPLLARLTASGIYKALKRSLPHWQDAYAMGFALNYLKAFKEVECR